MAVDTPENLGFGTLKKAETSAVDQAKPSEASTKQ